MSLFTYKFGGICVLILGVLLIEKLRYFRFLQNVCEILSPFITQHLILNKKVNLMILCTKINDSNFSEKSMLEGIQFSLKNSKYWKMPRTYHISIYIDTRNRV